MAESPTYPDSDSDMDRYPGAPRWVKIFAIVAGVPALLVAGLTFARGHGGHGPGDHMPGEGQEQIDADRGDAHDPSRWRH